MPRRNVTSTQRPRRSPRRPRRATPRVEAALVVIDHERLQAEAWAEFHEAQQRFHRAARELHLHEKTDVPAYEAWLHRTFPILITTLRELHLEVGTKTQQIQEVLAQSAFSGGSPKRLWRQQQARAAAERGAPERDPETDFSDDPASTRSRSHATADDFQPPAGPKPSRNAREIYRRLVQRLHPDRGGAWTPAREQLWHEVQRAWAAADHDWLARLEADWETANEVVGRHSPLSRLQRACEEIAAARRATEQKLRDYRLTPAWRFTRRAKTRAALHRRIESDLEHDLRFLQRQLAHLNATIAAWEEDWTRPNLRSKSHRRRFGRQTQSDFRR